MKTRLIPVSLALAGALLAGCGGDSQEIPAEPAAAYEKGTAALIEKDYPLALRAFQQVADDSQAGDLIRYQALLSQGEVQALSGDIPGAKASFAAARENYAQHHDIRAAKKIIDAYLNAADLEHAEAELKRAFEQFPEATAALATQRKAVELLASGDVSALSELGYAGD